ncbi:hypothetical protein M2152_000545 [Microbacteriaceae bacterium SG_E_30_P1]|uniref:PknH-like extracellular domain-containing protein n=1 Tax=Antiquaquibacter oligotrophicus TaxID=2880260 RepID=A0ABT6KK28_9MICO|nr:hypothetical protein [Antiquaquibacter oligotrophicus]MDH6180363.1 hypothetical protein [Antiquaquibacter oligotrophicus]UDF13895.1 hypothetical protein LH407_03290 [Antiquaquibacter oligotrophicus]
MSAAFPSPKPARQRGMRWWSWALIAAGVLAVIGILCLPVLGFFAYVNHSIRETSPDQPFLDGPAQDPDARSPLPCVEPCFGLDDAATLAVSAGDVSSLSIADELYGAGELDASTVADDAPAGGEQWLAVGGDAECAFVTASAPYISVGPDSTSQDPISWVQAWQTGDEVVDIAARVFPATESATAFMHDLHDRVIACPWQDLDIRAPGSIDTSLVQITSQAAIAVPDEVAAVGWVREGSPGARWRSYVWDLQRGNLVVQVRVLTDGRILERDVATFAELIADRLSQLEPTAS